MRPTEYSRVWDEGTFSSPISKMDLMVEINNWKVTNFVKHREPQIKLLFTLKLFKVFMQIIHGKAIPSKHMPG